MAKKIPSKQIEIKTGILNTEETNVYDIVSRILGDLGYPLLNNRSCCDGITPTNGQTMKYNSTTNRFELV